MASTLHNLHAKIDGVKESVFAAIPGGNQAAYLDAIGSKLRVGKAHMPVPGDDEILIQNHALAVNPVDWKIQDHGLFVTHYPAIIGSDIAGEVIEVGRNVHKFKKHDRVIAQVIGLDTRKPQDAGFQHYSTAPASTTAHLPATISYTHGVVLPLAISTAATGLYSPAEKGYLGLPYPSLNPPSTTSTLLVWGASSSVGILTVQLAVASGARVVAVASSHNHALLQSLGASAVVDYKTGDVVSNTVQAVKDLGGNFVGIYDAISLEDSYRHVVPILEHLGGNLATTLPPPETLPAGVKAGHVYAISTYTHPVWENYVAAALESGALKPAPEPLVIGTGLEHVQAGLEENKRGVSAKKVVIEL